MPMKMTASASNEIDDVAEAIRNTVTPEDASIVAQRFFNDPTVQVIKYDLTPYSAEKLGLLATHRQLKITIKKGDDGRSSEVASFFVKSVPYDVEKQAAFVNDEGLFQLEYFYFSELAPRLLDNHAGEKWSATCYLAKPDCLIMEDLRSQGYKLRGNLYDGYVEIKSALAAVARLHGSSILMEACLARKFKRATTLKEHYPEFFTEKAYNPDCRFYAWVTAGIDITQAIGKLYNVKASHLTRAYEELMEIVKPSAVHRNVVCHGDLWWNNIMFDDALPLPNCRLLDYQVMRYAPLGLDILQLLYIHTSREFRDKHESELVEFYHAILTETVKRSDLVVEAPSLDEVLRSVERFRVFGPASASLYLPTLLIDSSMIDELTKDSDGFDSYLFGDRTDITLTYLKSNEAFRDRMIEIVEELGEIGKRLEE